MKPLLIGYLCCKILSSTWMGGYYAHKVVTQHGDSGTVVSQGKYDTGYIFEIPIYETQTKTR